MNSFLPSFFLCALACSAQTGITVPPGTASLQDFIASHNGYTIQIPAGTYSLNNAAGQSGLTIYNFSGELDFASGANLVCTTYTTSAGWCVNIQNSKNIVIRGLWVGYANEATLPLARAAATNGAIQVWRSASVSIYNPHVDASTGIGLVVGLSSNVSVSQAEMFQTSADGLSFVNDSASSVDGLYASGTGDDGLSVINYGFYGNNVGFTGTNIQSYSSAARGISVPGQSNVNISNFYVANAAKSGIITQTDSSFQTRRPSNVSWSNGQITNSGLFGIQTDGADNVSYNNIQVSNSAAGGWYGCDVSCNNISAGNLSLNSGLGGSALFAGSITLGAFSNISISGNPTYGMFITNSSGLNFSNLTITNVSQTDSLGRAWWAENNVGTVSANGLTVIDSQQTPTGYIVGEFSNPGNSLTVTNITPVITNASLLIQTTSAGAVFRLTQ